MKVWYVSCFLLTYLKFGESYSKYGRTCKDIGCLSNEVCVMESDPCSYYQRQNECGSYPTCKKSNNAGPPSCSKYVCPPTKVCKMDGSTPKCVDDHSKVGKVGYDATELKTSNDQPSGGGNVYPSLQNGETTSRPNIGYQSGGNGYQGGQVGSGYPGRPSNNQQYPQQPYPRQGNNGYNPNGGYNANGGYNPNSGYNPNGGYNSNYNRGGYQGYPQGNNGYPQNGNYPQNSNYPQNGYNNGYQNGYQNNNQRYPNSQGGYGNYGSRGGYGQNTGSNSFVDSLTGALKNYGTKLLTDALTRQITGGNNNNNHRN